MQGAQDKPIDLKPLALVLHVFSNSSFLQAVMQHHHRLDFCLGRCCVQHWLPSECPLLADLG